MRRWITVLVLALPFLACIPEGYAQAPLRLINDSTTVRKISFRFVEGRTFDEERLQDQIITVAPGFGEKLRRLFRFIPGISPRTYPFDPIEFQKDVVRLRGFYQQNGFPNPHIDYPASQYDSTRNTIHLILTIQEGPPLRIQDVSFFGPDGDHAAYQFEEPLRSEWIRFRDRRALNVGERYTEVERIRIQDMVLVWLKDRGFAFARADAETVIDSTEHKVDLRFRVDAGPLGYFAHIQIEGNTSIGRRVLERELPFEVGDRFSNSKLSQGQQQLFGLNLFRVVLSDIPEQERSDSVTVRYRVREAKPRYVLAQTGYGFEEGVTAQASWQHRNLLGGGRQFSVSGAIQSGLGARPPNGRQPVRNASVSTSLNQPYLFTTRLSGRVSPFFLWEDNPNQVTRFRELGLETSAILDLLPFRTMTLRYTLARATPLGNTALPDLGATVRQDVYSRSILSLNATLGRLNNFLNPRRGILIRPLIETGGGLTGFITSDVEYYKASNDVIGYLPITRRSNLSARLSVGWLRPFGKSKDQKDPRTEFRFERIRFYAGGSTDVRGWANQLLGPKLAQADSVVTDDQGNPRALNARYESIGGETKLSGGLEFRFPFPGVSSSDLGLATFFDFGQVYDEGGYSLSNLHYGTGVGLRYQTPVGFLRLDLATKINPSDEDLQDPEAVYLFRNGFAGPPEDRFWRRFKVHLSLGQRF